jgi:hypothetical protein
MFFGPPSENKKAEIFYIIEKNIAYRIYFAQVAAW